MNECFTLAHIKHECGSGECLGPGSESHGCSAPGELQWESVLCQPGEPQALLLQTAETCWENLDCPQHWERATTPAEPQCGPKTPAGAEAAEWHCWTQLSSVWRKQWAAWHRWSKLPRGSFVLVLWWGFFFFFLEWGDERQSLVVHTLLWIKHPLSFVYCCWVFLLLILLRVLRFSVNWFSNL